MMALLLLLAAENALVRYLRFLVEKDPFRGLYHPTLFDWLILAPYFVILVTLAFYGLHRYRMIYLYKRYRRHAPGPPPPPEAWPREWAGWPSVTIQLPLYNEKYVVERLLAAVAAMDYPRERLEIQVLDDSSDDTVEIARVAVERYAAAGLPIRYFHRSHRTGYKAGALAEGLKEARGEFIALFDADFLPPADFLRRTIPYFADPQVGLVQARWTFLNRRYSLLTEVQAILLDAHFVLEHGGRSRAGLFFNFNGTAGVLRRAAIEAAGGWELDTLTEDSDLSYRAQLAGWRFLYVPDIECPSELPVDMNGFKAQQARWAKGLMQTAKKLLPRILRAPVAWRVKLEAFYHLTGCVSYPLMVALSVLLLPAMTVRFYQGWWQVLWIDLPLFLAASCSVSSFYLVAQRELFPRAWKRTFLLLPLLMAVGIGLALRNARAVLEAVWGYRSDFVRTPKYRIETAQKPFGEEPWYSKVYRAADRKWLPWVELGLGGYFCWATLYAITNENYGTVPFLCLFLWGYWYTGLLSLAQPYWERLALLAKTLAVSGVAGVLSRL
ncbi:MAG: glycosyltransferase [Acidobacteria bacterium]|nr:glycosyltransferase [Acidobacteriota bacterium]